jgi:hypothetical protein
LTTEIRRDTIAPIFFRPRNVLAEQILPVFPAVSIGLGIGEGISLIGRHAGAVKAEQNFAALIALGSTLIL